MEGVPVRAGAGEEGAAGALQGPQTEGLRLSLGKGDIREVTLLPQHYYCPGTGKALPSLPYLTLSPAAGGARYEYSTYRY